MKKKVKDLILGDTFRVEGDWYEVSGELHFAPAEMEGNPHPGGTAMVPAWPFSGGRVVAKIVGQEMLLMLDAETEVRTR